MLQHQQGKTSVSLQSHFTVGSPSGPLILSVLRTQSEPRQTYVMNLPILRAILMQMGPFTLNNAQSNNIKIIQVTGIRTSGGLVQYQTKPG